MWWPLWNECPRNTQARWISQDFKLFSAGVLFQYRPYAADFNGQAASLSIAAEEEVFGVRTPQNPVRNFFGSQGKATINPLVFS